MKKYIIFFIFLFFYENCLCQELPTALMQLQKSLQDLSTALPRTAGQISLQKPSELKRLSPISYESFRRHVSSIPIGLFDKLTPLNEALNENFQGILQFGYVFIKEENLFKGPSPENLAIGDKEQKIQVYKIHLMPRSPSDVMLILEHLLQEIKINDKLQNAVSELKFRPGIDFSQSKEEIKKQLGIENPQPIIVLYANGKDNAQYALDTAYRLFKDLTGLDITPRYNEKITSLIYYAQSNGDWKVADSEDYVQPNREVFRPDYVDPEHPVDYHLRNPAKK